MTPKHPLCPDYFAPAATALEGVLRRVKGSFRRRLIETHAKLGGLEAIPHAWRQHAISEVLKQAFQRRDPRARGGEDLPDLLDGEVEIARVTLVDSLHSEVTSLRARPSPDRSCILLTLVDEYETEFELPLAEVGASMTADEVLRLLQFSNPPPLQSACLLRVDSDFYPDLDDLAEVLQVKQLASER